MKKETYQNSAIREFGIELTTGALGAMAVAYASFPAEGFKKYVQSGQYHEYKELKNSGAPLDVLKKHKFRFYTGSTLFAFSLVPATAIQFGLKHLEKYIVPKDANWLARGFYYGCCGAGGAIAATFVENTVVLQQTRKQTAPQVLRFILFEKGILRGWKSYPQIAFRDFVFTYCMFEGGPKTRSYMREKFGKWGSPIGGLFVGLLGVLLTHPVDTVGTLRQKTEKKFGFIEGVKKLYAINGIRSFYRGASARCLLFTTYMCLMPFAKSLVYDSVVNGYSEAIKSRESRGWLNTFFPGPIKKATASTLENDVVESAQRPGK